MVGGAAMYPSKTSLKMPWTVDHTCHMVAVGKNSRTGGNITRSRSGLPYFAPVNSGFWYAAFETTVDINAEPENKSCIDRCLPIMWWQKWDATAIIKLIKEGNGLGSKTVAGEVKLWLMMKGRPCWWKMKKGGVAKVTGVKKMWTEQWCTLRPMCINAKM